LVGSGDCSALAVAGSDYYMVHCRGGREAVATSRSILGKVGYHCSNAANFFFLCWLKTSDLEAVGFSSQVVTFVPNPFPLDLNSSFLQN
jgi:hypothetical protein